MYRVKRYLIAKAADKVEAIGFMGLSCEGCNEELKRERGCHLPGYQYRAEVTWRIDYHEPLSWRDRALFCPRSVLGWYPDVEHTVEVALEIQEAGGLGASTGEAIDDLNAWYKGAYDLVMNAEKRAQQEQGAARSRLAEQVRREQEAASKMR